MRYATLLYFIILFSLLTTFVNGEEIPISELSYSWYLTGELTNTNPYSIFITVPQGSVGEVISLNKPDDFLSIRLSDSNSTIETEPSGDVALNGVSGFWLSPYTSVKIKIHNNIEENVSMLVDENQENYYGTSGPGLVGQCKNINPYKIIPIYKKGVLLGDFKLYVYGSIKKTTDTDVLSLVVPAPLVLNNYYRFNKIIGSNGVDIWENSYNNYLKEHNKMTYKMNPELYNLDNSLTPIEDGSFGIDYKLKPFDVPTMAFTTSNTRPVDFAYTMYWDSK